MNETELRIVEAMEKYGGDFVKALANAMRHADHINRAKIISTWPEYWASYEVMAKQAKRNGKERI